MKLYLIYDADNNPILFESRSDLRNYCRCEDTKISDYNIHVLETYKNRQRTWFLVCYRRGEVISTCHVSAYSRPIVGIGDVYDFGSYTVKAYSEQDARAKVQKILNKKVSK